MGDDLVQCEEPGCGEWCHGLPDGKGGVLKRCLKHRPAEPPAAAQEPVDAAEEDLS